MANQNALQDWLDEDGFDTPLIKSRKHPEGKTYHIASPDYDTGIHLQRIADLGAKVHAGGDITKEDQAKLKLDDDQEKDFSKMVLGDTCQEMIDDGVNWDRIRKLTKYTFAFYTLGEEAAEKIAAPKAPENRAGRRSGGKKKKGASSGAK